MSTKSKSTKTKAADGGSAGNVRKASRPRDEMAIMLKLAGREYRLRPGDFTPRDDLAVYQACGVSIMQIFAGEVHLFTLMALLWRSRVNDGETDLTWDEVLDEGTFADFNDVEILDEAAASQEDADRPEA